MSRSDDEAGGKVGAASANVESRPCAVAEWRVTANDSTVDGAHRFAWTGATTHRVHSSDAAPRREQSRHNKATHLSARSEFGFGAEWVEQTRLILRLRAL